MISSSFGAIKVCEERNMVFISLQSLETGINCILLNVFRGKEPRSSVCMQATAHRPHWRTEADSAMWVSMIYESMPSDPTDL